MNSVAVCAQEATPAQSDRQIRQLLENCLKQQEELDHLTAKVAALEKLDRQGKELVAALDAQILAQEKTIKALKAVDATSGKIEILDAKTEASLQASLTDAKAQIARLTAEVRFWRKIAGFGIIVALVVGAGIGVVATK